MKDYEILSWKKNENGKSEYITVVQLETLNTIKVTDMSTLRGIISAGNIKYFINNIEKYPYIDGDTTNNSDTYIVVKRSIIKNGEIAYLLMGWNGNVFVVTGKDILNYKIKTHLVIIT